MSAPLFFLAIGGGALAVRAGVRAARNVNWGPMKEAFASSTSGLREGLNMVSSLRVDRSGFQNPMTTTEAYQILNLNPTAGKDDIRTAHRFLMLRNHPDNGGSNFVASKINEAKTLLSPK